MSWFKRIKRGITTKNYEREKTPEGFGINVRLVRSIHQGMHKGTLTFVVLIAGHHQRLGSARIFLRVLFDSNQFTELPRKFN